MINEFADSGVALRSGSQPDAPNEEIASSGAGHDAHGRFTTGNAAALRHGGRSRRVQAGLMPEQAEARAALSERVNAIVSDLGGPDALSAIAVGQVQRHARLELVDGFLWANLQQHGPLTGKGRTRACLVAWLSVVDRLQKSAMALGLDRRSRHVDPLERVRQAVAEANAR